MSGRVTVDGEVLRIQFPYDVTKIAAVKRIPGRQFETEPFKHWTVPATPWHAKRAVNELGKLGFDFDFDISKLVREHKRGFKSNTEVAHGQVGEHDLYPYQEQAVEFIDYTGGRCLIGDEMGLGKTVETLSWVQRRPKVHNMLVVAPANVVWKWKKECDKWLERMEAGIIEGFTGPIPDAEALIISYTSMAERQDELAHLLQSRSGNSLIVFDECHYLKNHKAKRTKAAKNLAINAEYMLGLSGTPFLNRPIEMFTVLNMLDPVAWPSAWSFGINYCGGPDHPRGFFQGATNREELRERLQGVMLRRLKSDVLSELPPLTRSYIPVDIPNMNEYNSTEGELYMAINQYTGQMYLTSHLTDMTALRAVMGKGKAQAALPWIEEFLEQNPNEKLVVYCHHTQVIDIIKDGLEGDYIVGEISGRIASGRRERIISNYQELEYPRVLVINEAGGQGIDLFSLGEHGSSTILFVEREWTPALEEQAEGRLHRRGQHDAVTAYYLVARNTIDERISRAIDEKREVIRDVVSLPDIKEDIQEQVLRSMVEEAA